MNAGKTESHHIVDCITVIAVLRQKQLCGRTGQEVDVNLLRLEVANNNFYLCLNLEIYFKYLKGIVPREEYLFRLIIINRYFLYMHLWKNPKHTSK